MFFNILSFIFWSLFSRIVKEKHFYIIKLSLHNFAYKVFYKSLFSFRLNIHKS